EPQPEGIEAQLPLVQLLARLLAGILDNELRAEEESRRAERVVAGSTVDPLTGLSNQGAWDAALVAEEARCRRHGHHASVIAIAVFGADGGPPDDAVLANAAETVRSVSRASDLVAHFGGGQLAVLAA